MHWRLAGNSPLTGYSQGRIMGGGSSVMGMVALRGTPDDYAEWEALGAAGWGWNDVLPFFRKLENDFDFGGEMHGSDGPVPIRRLPREQWPPISKALQGFADERQIPFVADMNADFRDGYAVAADQQLAGQARLGGDLLSRRRRARAGESDDRQRRDGDRHQVRRPPRHRRQRRRSAARRREFTGREIIVSLGGIHSPAHADALRHRPGGASARAWHRGARRPARRRRQSVEPFAAVHRLSSAARRRGSRRRCGPHPARCCAFRPGVPGCPPHRHVHQRAEQDLVERARHADRQSRAVAVEADGARPRGAALGAIIGRSRWSR